MIRSLIFSLIFCITVFAFCAPKLPEAPPPAQSIAELQDQLEQVLKETHTPGISIAIVNQNGPVYVAGLGLTDVATGRPATKETLFRIGSVSKGFTSLAILKLASEGKLSLNARVHEIAPEVWFKNRWEKSDPIRVVHLLEHTTGWDDMHFREYSKENPDLPLKEALDYDHSSRTSRWRPGTRTAYCNSGPAVAAYIVEKISGIKFENYVKENFFDPIGMKTATYYKPPSDQITTLYRHDGRTPLPYWHILYRPAGSINASADDMAAYLSFYLNRGKVNGKQVLSPKDLDRMETPESVWGVQEGLTAGYGLSNYTTIANGFVWHGHDGGVDGALTEIAYMPDYGVGYFYSINTSNGKAFMQIGKIIQAYITRNLPRAAEPTICSLSDNALKYAGWYQADSPRQESMRFIEILLAKLYVHFKDGDLLMTSLNGTDIYKPVTDRLFCHAPKAQPIDPIPTLALLNPNPEGQFIQLSWMTIKRIPAWLAISEIIITGLVLLSIISILLYAPFWILGGLRKKWRRPQERVSRLCPLIAVLSLIGSFILFGMSATTGIFNFGKITLISVSLFLLTIIFALVSIAGTIMLWRSPKDNVRKSVRIYLWIVNLALLIVTVFLTYWGVIGIRTWA